LTNEHPTEEEISLQVMAYLDGELDPEETEKVRLKIESDKRFRDAHRSLLKIKEATSNMELKKLPEMYWDDYWKHVYNRIERGVSWIFISIGAILLLGYGIWEFLNVLIRDHSVNLIVKTGILVLLIGLVILMVSVLREKLMVRKFDKYREIER
jgi:hypothetical protein